MRKIILTVPVVFLLILHVTGFAAVNSTGQSVMWARMGSRNDSLDIDAVFFNPAGTTRLEDGLHLYLSHVSMYGHGRIENDSVLPAATEQLRDEYKIRSFNFYWLNAYVDYKKGPYSIFLSYEPVGGCGGGEYPHGTPEDHLGFYVYQLFNGYSSMQVNEMYSKGGGGFIGPAVGAAYAVNDYIAIGLKLRYIYGFFRAEGTYDITFFRPSGGADRETWDVAFGYDSHGWGATGGISITPLGDRRLSIGITYDYFSRMAGTDLEYYSDDTVPGAPFQEGDDLYQQVPSRLGIGVGYYFLPQLRASISYDQSFDKYADMCGDDIVEHGFRSEVSAGVEYIFNNGLTASIGYGIGTTAYKEEHNSDNNFETARQRIHTGISYAFTKETVLHLAYTGYIGFPARNEEDLFSFAGVSGQSTYYRYLHWLAIGIQSRFF
jgi:long-chain fatty acid transport protein